MAASLSLALGMFDGGFSFHEFKFDVGFSFPHSIETDELLDSDDWSSKIVGLHSC